MTDALMELWGTDLLLVYFWVQPAAVQKALSECRPLSPPLAVVRAHPEALPLLRACAPPLALLRP